MSGRTFKAACVQMRSGIDEAKNVATMCDLVRQAAARGANYVQTPEMTGQLVRDRAALFAVLKDDAHSAVFAAAAELARDLGIFVHIGSTAIAIGENRAANRAAVFAPDGRLIATYDKIHMFDVDLDNGESWRESATYRPGEVAQMASLPWTDIGLAVCYDVRFPHLFRQQAQAGAAVLTAPAAFTAQTGRAHWHVLQRARAIENGAWMISAAQGGLHEDGRQTYGHSLIVDPWGAVIAELAHDEPGVIVAEIDPAQSAAARAKIPSLKNGRDFAPVARAGEVGAA